MPSWSIDGRCMFTTSGVRCCDGAPCPMHAPEPVSRVYLVEWLGVQTYIRALSRDKAKMRAIRSARGAGMWQPGQSVRGLRAVVASYVPPDVAVMDSVASPTRPRNGRPSMLNAEGDTAINTRRGRSNEHEHENTGHSSKGDQVTDLRHRLALLLAAESERALTAEERLEKMTRERDEARAQLAAADTGSPCDGHRP